jgi:uncharacterized protein (TIGR00369 family)
MPLDPSRPPGVPVYDHPQYNRTIVPLFWLFSGGDGAVAEGFNDGLKRKEMRNSLDEQTKILERFFDKAPMKRAFGMELSFTDGQAVFDMPYNPSFDHSLGGVHGGVIATLLDNAGWFNVALHYDLWVATADLHVQFLESVNGSPLRATGQVIRTGKNWRLPVWKCKIAMVGL